MWSDVVAGSGAVWCDVRIGVVLRRMQIAVCAA